MYLAVPEAKSNVQEASSGYLEQQEASSAYREMLEASSECLEVQVVK